MKQRIVISGRGGQGVLTLTRVLAEAAMAAGQEVITSETHGMAQRGGTVISMVKVGAFRGPLIPTGAADVGLFLAVKNLGVHRAFLAPGARVFVHAAVPGDYEQVDAQGLAAEMGLPVNANLILLGFAAARGGLFCGEELLERIIMEKIPARFRDSNIAALRQGAAAAKKIHHRGTEGTEKSG